MTAPIIVDRRESGDPSLRALQADMNDIKTSMSRIADALTAIAVLEEKHQTVAVAVVKAVDKIEKLEERQSSMELESAKQQSSITTAIKAVTVAWAVLGTGILTLVGKFIVAFSASAPIVIPAVTK